MFDGTEDWCKIWRKTDLCFLEIFVYRLKNSSLILESKMAELNWKQNLLIYFENCQNSKTALLLPSVRPGTEYTWALVWKKSLLIYFVSYQGIPYLFPYSRIRQEFEHFANG